MGLKYYKNKTTGEQIRTLNEVDTEQWEQVLVAPNSKFMESTDPIHNKSRIKNANKILKERSRNHARDHDIDETIQINKLNGLDEQVARSFLNGNGKRRTKLDDI